MGRKNKKHIALDAFIAMCDTLKQPYQIGFRYRQYRTSNIKSCTVTIGQKQFTERDEKDAMYLALSKAIKYMLNTYSVFIKQKEMMDEVEKKNNELSPCIFDIKKFNQPPG